MSMRLTLAALFTMAVTGFAMAEDKKRDEDKATRDADKPFTDAEFVKKAAACGLAEVKISEAVQSKTQDPKVRAFAARMVTDHTKANSELMGLAPELSVELPAQLDAKHQKHVDHFTNATGENVAREYIEHSVKAHEESVAMFRKATTEAKNPKLKEWATKTLPTIEEHLKSAKEMQSQLKQ